MPKMIKNDISVTPRHRPAENVQKRNVRKVSNSAEIITPQFMSMCILHMHIFTFMYHILTY